MKKSKRYLTAASKVDKTKFYSLDEALNLIKEIAKAKFDESIEAHIRLGIDASKGEQQIRATVVLPHGAGKTKKVAVFSDNEKEVAESGADLSGGKELIEKIKNTGVIDFDVAVATPEIMKDMATIAKILGPKGLMPSPKNETVSKNIKKTVEELKKGKITFKNDETCNLHQFIGKVSWPVEKIKENYEIFFEAVKKAKPSGVKGAYIKQIVLCSTMGPGVKIMV
ncbi:50S ribosomal protein L1 [Candidatus Kuenenbacteria bacterium CG10_big_fil_rev_8_21_14_0_10_36_11]|uniref:Large ribosomal subunit protein uL1 n=1 Tax=Candidatus Kuenenbacteria bacterium CG10_big_fil_rev_8_21_14_0_10_36_11 TaxID=1974618 RepID=A0A2M6WA68_9BACT|nr:MAG: 50S ribosomal protein L1 [Candidatus Kuenenbacteria bacterium CG10_big_fil_rev_8_21_14_0_10_36_11]